MKTISYNQPASDAELDELAVIFMNAFGASAQSAALAISAIDLSSHIKEAKVRHVEEAASLISKALGFKPTYQDGQNYEWEGPSRTLMMLRKQGLEFKVATNAKRGRGNQ